MPQSLFKNCIVKRAVQEYLFHGIKVPKGLGLGGPNPKPYEALMKEHADMVVLCDYNPPAGSNVHKNSLIGEYQLVMPQWVDADFCKAWSTNELDIMYLYESMKRNGGKYLTITVSAHDGRKEIELLQDINRVFGADFSNEKPAACITFPKLDGRQYLHVYDPIGNVTMIKYRDSGDNMIGLKIVIPSSTSKVVPQKEVLEKKNTRQCMHTETAKKIFDKILEKYEFSEDGITLTAAEMAVTISDVKARQLGGALGIVLDPKYIINVPGIARRYKVIRK